MILDHLSCLFALDGNLDNFESTAEGLGAYKLGPLCKHDIQESVEDLASVILSIQVLCEFHEDLLVVGRHGGSGASTEPITFD